MSMRALSKTGPAARAYIRYASTESAAQKATQAATQAATSAASAVQSQGLTKTLCNLYKAATGPLPATVKAPLNKAAGFLEPVLYYSEVAFHMCKQVVVRQNFTLPTKADFAASETQLFKVLDMVKIRNIKSLKDVSLAQWTSGAVKAFELSALFVVAEMVGRGSIVGYKD
ncbi:hypothetical protein H4R18_000672 [Coemansia javaensis]|uniref:Uncharacterized protein n=1 Tax=Coemansia javaensis TaxID=2761396 RepID=A0A9W8HNW4_9FUNG|nr:hypothetical protein H4R18_000672 [Coemansia javaensis]